MPYKLIRGEFHIHYPDDPRNGPEPDGDTLKFLPDDPMLVEAIARATRSNAEFNNRGMINIRFEAIDTLETHFGGSHQNLEWAEAARDLLLDAVGFGEVVFFDDLPNKVQSVEHHPRRGFILSETIESNGRLVAFVYTEDAGVLDDELDGADVWVDAAMARASLNAHLLEAGLAYPTFYTTMPIELKDTFAALTREARDAGRGLFPDETMTPTDGVELADLRDVEDSVLWPKAGRRLISYFAAGFRGLAAFDGWLRADPINRDDRVQLPNREIGNMHDLFEYDGNVIRMKYLPEDLIILPDTDAVVVAPVPPTVARQRGDVAILAALIDPIGTDLGNELVTLLNRTPDRIDLTGWVLAGQGSSRVSLQGVMEAGAALQVRLTARLRLSNEGGTITLLSRENTRIDQVSYRKKDVTRPGWTLVF